MLDDLGHVRLVTPTNLTRCPLSKIGESTVHPVLPENTDAVAKRRKIRLDHTKGSVDGPENEEDDEQVVRVPESFELSSSRFLGCCPGHGGQGDQHDISTPSRPSSKVGDEESDEAELVDLGEYPQIPPMRNGVQPGEKDDGPPDQFVEGDVLVEGNDAVEWSPTGHGDQVPAHREQDEGYVDVEGQSRGTRYGEGESERGACSDGIVLEAVMCHTKTEDHQMQDQEGEDETEAVSILARGTAHATYNLR